MTVWGLLAPKGWVLISGVGAPLVAVLTSVQFSNTVTIGSILVASLVIVLSGLFTLRNNLHSYWRGLAEERSEKIAALEEEAREREQHIRDQVAQNREDMLAFTEEQRTIRHELRNELAAAKGLLEVERAKTDLTGLMEQLSTMHTEAMDRIGLGIEQQREILGVLAPIAQLAVRLTENPDADRSNE